MCGWSEREPLERDVAHCDTVDMRLFWYVSPGITLLCVLAGVGTMLFGLVYGAAFIVGAGALALGHAIDNYGLSSEDKA